ncbi:MAG: 16S rRNA (adenine(1518)-N(6)/adenine(1519)-N(6))-dimethyltransferase [Gammaproteobacteria bacterium]|nr:MAG: 16S rRNA (adenine(1518)-N(6)/adenine(1519)-N(6))-dimethyltransferase [Gammaproteobacteria bacterium]RKZ96663.1 MAG: 16S rRNA (adenine(1518)-N(6)/adenine(1519)-N(6))-dimethyltransferase [Gammaproteobacteria bacterium]RKZ96964.1 MAG: 16S rRNA (adenine(1518)-N(6)/adenine(1519)-N(6))-dimethyltransferase [Gammaproteobacteria bacterium]
MESTLIHKARKRFGQNFLHDQHVISDIVAAIDPQPGQHLVEIGPGRAALTVPLLQSCDQLDVIELDRDLVPLLQAKLAGFPHLTIHQADALAFDYSSLVERGEKLRVIGNLPYNITTPLLFHLLSQASYVEDMCFMLQREVVERICAQPGSKTYGRLSIMVQYQCEAVLLFIVPPEAFDPIPKVESAIIYLRPLDRFVGGDVPIDALNTVVTKAFSQRRKTISNTLKNIVSQSVLQAENIDLQQRPETISVKQYVAITRAWLTEKEVSN